MTWIKGKIAAMISSEVAAAKNRYNKKCTECRELQDRALKTDRTLNDLQGRIKALDGIVERKETELEQNERTLEERDNRIALDKQTMIQQQFMIQRDIENRKLELMTAQLQTATARATASGVPPAHEAKDGYHDDESSINHRPGR